MRLDVVLYRELNTRYHSLRDAIACSSNFDIAQWESKNVDINPYISWLAVFSYLLNLPEEDVLNISELGLRREEFGDYLTSSWYTSNYHYLNSL